MLQAGNESLIMIMFVTIVLISVMLLVVYRSITTALLVLFMVMLELNCGRGIVSFLAFHKLIGISEFASNLLVSLILVPGPDYAIFLIGRYHEARHAGEDRETAYYSAVNSVCHVILGSGLGVAGATFCLKFTRLNYFNTCGSPALWLCSPQWRSPSPSVRLCWRWAAAWESSSPNAKADSGFGAKSAR